MAQLPYLLTLMLVSSYTSEASNILVLYPFPSKSHAILGDATVRLLLEAGHEVTYITPFPKKDPPPKLHQVDVSANIEILPTDFTNIKLILDKQVSVNNMQVFFSVLLGMGNMTFNNENVQKLINDPLQKFDLVIIEWMFSEIYTGLSVIYECPFIWFTTTEPHSVVLGLIDEGLNPSYNADAISGNIPPFTFKQRLLELWSQIQIYFFRNFLLLKNEKNIYEHIFGPIMAKRGKPLPPFDDVRFNASLMLGNSHVSLGQPIRLPQNYKPVGGYHIDPIVKPLQGELKTLLDNAKNGLIYFSMGSNIKSKDMPNELKHSLLKMFGQLKYTVLWKFEKDLPDLPNNVHIVDWAPQTSILAHPNCVLFITHGGLLSTTETVSFGVPVIGIPVFADQYTNVDRAVSKGYAKRVDLSYTMADDMKAAIENVLSNPSYAAKAKELSYIYNHRPTPPSKELVHWVEHVIQTGGAPHLRSVALQVPWYQKFYLDLVVLILAVIIILKITIKRICCSKKKVTEEKKKN